VDRVDYCETTKTVGIEVLPENAAAVLLRTSAQVRLSPLGKWTQ